MPHRTNGYVLSTGGWRSATGAAFDIIDIVSAYRNYLIVIDIISFACYLIRRVADSIIGTAPPPDAHHELQRRAWDEISGCSGLAGGAGRS